MIRRRKGKKTDDGASSTEDDPDGSPDAHRSTDEPAGRSPDRSPKRPPAEHGRARNAGTTGNAGPAAGDDAEGRPAQGTAAQGSGRVDRRGTDEADGAASRRAHTVSVTDAETKKLLKDLKKQQKRRLEQVLTEAKEMERRAKELAKKAKDQKKTRAEYAKHTEYVKRLAPQLGLDPERPITEVPELTDPTLSEVEFVTVQEGRSYVRVVFDQAHNRYLYQVIEPQLSRMEEEVLEFLRDTLVRTMDGRSSTETTDPEDYLTDQIERAVLDHSVLVDDVSKQRLEYYLVRDFLGYGPIDALMRDPMIEDISCDGPGITIYLFHRQYESIKTNVVFDTEQQLDSFVIRLAQSAGKHISIADPLLDATLPDTSRLQATLSREVTTRGSSFTIRRFRADPLTPPDLVRLGSMNARMAAFFWLAMEHGSSIIYAGGTASGKTTLLNAVSQFIPPQKKIVSIEDTREINLMHENWIAGLTRTGFGGETGEGGKPAGSIDMYRLLAAALRQRPEFLLVGEVRGSEALTLFQAMATGHATYSTLHADSVQSAVYRLENEPINVPRLMLQTLDAMVIQTQVRIDDRMVRRVKEIVELVGMDPETGDLLTNRVYNWDQAADTHHFLGKSRILEEIAEKNSLTLEQMGREWDQRTQVIDWMLEKGIRQISDVANVVAAYYAKPDAVLARIKRSSATVPDGSTSGLEMATIEKLTDAEVEALHLENMEARHAAH